MNSRDTTLSPAETNELGCGKPMAAVLARAHKPSDERDATETVTMGVVTHQPNGDIDAEVDADVDDE